MRIAKIVGLIGAAIVTLTACVPDFQGNPNGPKVAVLGDSITYDAGTAQHAALDGDHFVSVLGQPGFTVGMSMDAAAEYWTWHRPQVAVIELGTNDAARAVPEIETILGLLYMTQQFQANGASCVITTTLPTRTPWADYNARADSLNRGLRMGARVVDYDVIAAQPGMTYDSVHPTPQGAAWLAAATLRAVRSCSTGETGLFT